MLGHVALMGETRDVYRILVGKPKGKRPLVRPRRRCEINNKMGVQEVDGPGSSVGITTGYGLDGPGIESR